MSLNFLDAFHKENKKKNLGLTGFFFLFLGRPIDFHKRSGWTPCGAWYSQIEISNAKKTLDSITSSYFICYGMRACDFLVKERKEK